MKLCALRWAVAILFERIFVARARMCLPLLLVGEADNVVESEHDHAVGRRGPPRSLDVGSPDDRKRPAVTVPELFPDTANWATAAPSGAVDFHFAASNSLRTFHTHIYMEKSAESANQVSRHK
jgi:hypothetical protein